MLPQSTCEVSEAIMNISEGLMKPRNQQGDGLLQLGDLLVDTTHQLVTRRGREVKLPRLSFALLATLIEAAPHAVSIDELLDRVWPGLVVGPETVAQRVKLLRKALGDDSRSPRYIEGVRGRGYRLVCGISVAKPQATGWKRGIVPRTFLARTSTLLLLGVFGGSILWVTQDNDRIHPALSLDSEADSGTSLSINGAARSFYLQALALRNEAAGVYGSPSEIIRRIEDNLDKAITHDARFAEAYAERAAVRIGRYITNMAFDEATLRQIQDDVSMASRLAPESAKTLAMQAWYAMFIERNFDSALDAFAQSFAAGLADPAWALDAANLMHDLDYKAEALNLIEQALAIDPRSTTAMAIYAWHLAGSERLGDALDVLEKGLALFREDLALQRIQAMLLYYWRHEQEPIIEFAARLGTEHGRASDVESQVLRAVLLRMVNQLHEANSILVSLGEELVRPPIISFGKIPVAAERGWTNLLLGRHDHAAVDGDILLRFLSEARLSGMAPESIHLLEAMAYTFKGEAELALAQAEAAGSHDAPPLVDGLGWFKTHLAAVHAWNGDHDTALELVQNLARERPMLGTSMHMLDPILAKPLTEGILPVGGTARSGSP